MTPRPLFLAGAVAAASCGACAGPGAREFAVVLQEPERLDCAPRIEEPDVDIDGLGQLFSYITTDWRARFEAGLLQPTGGRLHLVHRGDRSFAWFADLRQGQYQPWNGLVFEGEPQDGFVEARIVASHDTGAPGCGDQGELVDTDSVLLATLDGGELDGRIRRVEYAYVPSPSSPCAAYIECARSISVIGAEEE